MVQVTVPVAEGRRLVWLTGTCLAGPCPSSMLGGAARGHVYQQQCTSSGLVVVWSKGGLRMGNGIGKGLGFQ